MLNLQLLQRERARLYKNGLRKQHEQRQQMRKNQSMQIKSKDKQDLKQMLDIAIKEKHFEKQRQIYMNNKLKEENIMLASLKNISKQLQQSYIKQIPLKGNSLLDTLYNHSQKRGNDCKNMAKNLSLSYQEEENIKKMANKEIKSHELIQDQRHLERIKQIQELRKHQNQQIKNKYSPEPKVGDIHKRLQQLNEDYRRQLESFAYKGRDILDVLKRDDSKQMFEKSKRVQQQLKHQIEEKKIKDEYQKQQYLGQPENLRNSILGGLLFKGNNFDKKQYSDFLVRQMNETDLKRNAERIQNKQKVQINSIFGGQGGPERLKMIKMIDKNLGIETDYLKNVEPGNKSSSPFRMKNLYQYNGQGASTKGLSRIQDRNSKQPTIFQKHNTEEAWKNEGREKSARGGNQQTIKLSSTVIGQHSPRSYLGYDLIKGSPLKYEY